VVGADCNASRAHSAFLSCNLDLVGQRPSVARLDGDDDLLRPDATGCGNGRCPSKDPGRGDVFWQGVGDGSGEGHVASVSDADGISQGRPILHWGGAGLLGHA
jgi:hypothetical protein